MPTREQRKREWEPFQPATIPGGVEAIGFDKCWLNNRYQVLEKLQPDGMTHLSIKRRDKEWIHDWRELQRIKNELCGREREAVELYPAESRLVDQANQYHLWVLPPGDRYHFGDEERQVGDESEAVSHGAKQRPFEFPPEG